MPRLESSAYSACASPVRSWLHVFGLFLERSSDLEKSSADGSAVFGSGISRSLAAMSPEPLRRRFVNAGRAILFLSRYDRNRPGERPPTRERRVAANRSVANATRHVRRTPNQISVNSLKATANFMARALRLRSPRQEMRQMSQPFTISLDSLLNPTTSTP